MNEFSATTFSTVVRNYVVAGLGIISGVIIARALTPAARGEVAIAVLWSSILAMIAEFGLGFALAYYAGRGISAGNLWSLSLVLSALVGGLFSILAIAFVYKLHVNNLNIPLIIGMSTIPFNLLAGYQAQILLGLGLINDQIRLRMVMPAVYTSGVVVCALLRAHSPSSYLVSFGLAHLLSAVAALIIVQRRLEARFHLDWQILPRLARYGAKTYAASMSAQTSLKLDQLIISTLLSKSEIGYYAVSASMANILGPLFSGVAMVALPAAIGAEGVSDGRRKLFGALSLCLACSAPVLIAVFMMTPDALPFLFGQKYRPSVVSAQLLVLASLPQGLNLVLGNTLRGFGRPGLPAVGEVAGMIVTVVLLWTLLPKWRIEGAASASLIAYSTVAIILCFFAYWVRNTQRTPVGEELACA